MLLFFLSLIETEEQRELFTKLYEEHCHTLYVCAYRYLKNSADAEDVVQDVYFKVADKCIDTMVQKSDEDCRRFLYICAKHRAINYGKHKSKVVSFERLEEKGFDVSAGLTDESFVDMIIEQQLLEKAKAAIKGLDPKYGDVLWMSFEGYSVSDIAGFFNEKEETIKKRIYRGKLLLREAMLREGGEA